MTFLEQLHSLAHVLHEVLRAGIYIFVHSYWSPQLLALHSALFYPESDTGTLRIGCPVVSSLGGNFHNSQTYTLVSPSSPLHGDRSDARPTSGRIG